jgi:dTDP-4-amino-4,6-dideoxygalactose transaminase
MIPFNKPFVTGKELDYISDAISTGKISGNGKYTQLVHNFFTDSYKFRKALLTSSCTDALEMCALLLDIRSGDEVIIPSYTFVSTANAFILRGAKIVFADSRSDHPGIDEDAIESLITPKTKAIVVVHYAGVACDMQKIMSLSEKYGVAVVEDSAHAIDSYYLNQKGEKLPLGSIGHLATFSFHETKNISSGEGGLLAINDEKYSQRAEIIWEKGTNRSSFFRGEVNKYGWVDLGSSFLPSEITAAFLWAQLEQVDRIQKKRIELWENYHRSFSGLVENFGISLPKLPSFATNNGHMYYLVAKNGAQRDHLLEHLKKSGFLAVFHYLSLHKSEFFSGKHDGRELSQSDRYSDCLVRLPFFFELKETEQTEIIHQLIQSLESFNG